LKFIFSDSKRMYTYIQRKNAGKKLQLFVKKMMVDTVRRFFRIKEKYLT